MSLKKIIPLLKGNFTKELSQMLTVFPELIRIHSWKIQKLQLLALVLGAQPWL